MAPAVILVGGLGASPKKALQIEKKVGKRPPLKKKVAQGSPILSI